MARKMARYGDTTIHGGYPGKITESGGNELCNGRRIARVGDTAYCSKPYYPGGPPHGVQRIVSGSENTLATGRRVARVGDKLTCGATIVSGSENTFVN